MSGIPVRSRDRKPENHDMSSSNPSQGRLPRLRLVSLTVISRVEICAITTRQLRAISAVRSSYTSIAYHVIHSYDNTRGPEPVPISLFLRFPRVSRGYTARNFVEFTTLSTRRRALRAETVAIRRQYTRSDIIEGRFISRIETRSSRQRRRR